jgi:hypothetical protein
MQPIQLPSLRHVTLAKAEAAVLDAILVFKKRAKTTSEPDQDAIRLELDGPSEQDVSDTLKALEGKGCVRLSGQTLVTQLSAAGLFLSPTFGDQAIAITAKLLDYVKSRLAAERTEFERFTWPDLELAGVVDNDTPFFLLALIIPLLRIGVGVSHVPASMLHAAHWGLDRGRADLRMLPDVDAALQRAHQQWELERGHSAGGVHLLSAAPADASSECTEGSPKKPRPTRERRPLTSEKTRSEFSKRTMEVLAKRVGMRCSNPDCRTPTMGPRSARGSFVCIGVAAHITAAASGGKRYDARLTREQRSSESNGIWLCQNHAKLVDNDDVRYSVSLLLEWRRNAEADALAEIEGTNLQATRRK